MTTITAKGKAELMDMLRHYVTLSKMEVRHQEEMLAYCKDNLAFYEQMLHMSENLPVAPVKK